MSEFTTIYELLMLVMVGIITYVEVYSLLRILKQDKQVKQTNPTTPTQIPRQQILTTPTPIRVGLANADPMTIPNINNYSSFQS